MVKVEKKLKKDEKPLVCYSCGGCGHTSMQCSSDALFCRMRQLGSYGGRKPLVKHHFCCKGFVEGQFVDDTVLDTGCSRMLVRSDLVKKDRLNLKKSVSVQ